MAKETKPTVIAVVGPTASGKTSLSIALAKSLGAEIIACDSRTVYRYFDIGTAKPTIEERAGIPHHLLDVAEPDEDYTVAQFVEQSQQAIADITARGLLPIVCGGTGFYSRALLEGLSIPNVGPQEELRAELRAFAEKEGNQALHDRLRAVDPACAERLAVNDVFRIIRALEVYTVSGQRFSDAAKRVEPPYRTIWIGLTAEDRAVLNQSVRLRFDQQVADGMLEETERLYARYGAHQKLMHTVNYKQLVKFIEGKMDRESAFQEAIQHNIQLARKQLIWFRANPKMHWLAIDRLNKSELHDAASAYIEESLRNRFP